MLTWSRFSALFLAAGVGVSEAFRLVDNEPAVMRYAIMAAALALIAGAVVTDGKRRLAVLSGAWAFAAGVFVVGVCVRLDADSRFVLQRAPAFFPRMLLGLALSVAGLYTTGVVLARRERALQGIGLPDDTIYQ